MHILFLKLKGPYQLVNDKVFNALGLRNVFSVFGFNLKLEQNTYEYEDQYDYTLFIKKDIINEIKTSDSMENNISMLIRDSLIENLKIDVLLEKG